MQGARGGQAAWVRQDAELTPGSLEEWEEAEEEQGEQEIELAPRPEAAPAVPEG